MTDEPDEELPPQLQEFLAQAASHGLKPLAVGRVNVPADTEADEMKRTVMDAHYFRMLESLTDEQLTWFVDVMATALYADPKVVLAKVSYQMGLAETMQWMRRSRVPDGAEPDST